MAERDFNLEMTGEQVKDALQQLEDRVAEGWAVGAKDGTPVTSGSPYYENNAKYYSEQAENAATRAESAVPAGVDSAVLFTQAQQLTTAQQEQARQNIKAGGSNRNLLDNPWFTINQRGLASYSTAYAYTADRWINRGGVISVVTDGIQWEASSGHYFMQKIEPSLANAIADKTVTASVLFADGTIANHVFVAPQSGSTYANNFAFGSTLGLAFQNNVSGSYGFWLRAGATTTFNIRAIKLEIGSASTLANDTPPNYAEELAKCQYYFRRFGSSSDQVFVGAARAVSATAADCYNLLGGSPMAQVPTAITITGTMNYSVSGTAYAVSSASPVGSSPNSLNIRAYGTFPTGTEGLFVLTSGSFLSLSAEL